MKFKIDENLPVEAAAPLCGFGFDTQTVWDENLSGAPDEVLAQKARVEGRILVSLDLEFANIQGYPPHQHPGIIIHPPEPISVADEQSARIRLTRNPPVETGPRQGGAEVNDPPWCG